MVTSSGESPRPASCVKYAAFASTVNTPGMKKIAYRPGPYSAFCCFLAMLSIWHCMSAGDMLGFRRMTFGPKSGVPGREDAFLKGSSGHALTSGLTSAAETVGCDAAGPD